MVVKIRDFAGKRECGGKESEDGSVVVDDGEALFLG